MPLIVLVIPTRPMMGIKCQVRTEIDSKKRESDKEEAPVAAKYAVWVWTFSISFYADKDGAGLRSSYTGISDPEEPCRSVLALEVPFLFLDIPRSDKPQTGSECNCIA